MFARIFRLERRQLIPRPRTEVFAFFSEAANLEAITPPLLRFRIMTPQPIQMQEGARIDYRLSLLGVPLGWRTRITEWQPDARFVDEQESGPYASWHHVHEFESHGDDTVMRDVIDYQLPLGPLGSLAHALWVRRTLEQIFDFRREATIRYLGAPTPGGESLGPVPQIDSTPARSR